MTLYLQELFLLGSRITITGVSVTGVAIGGTVATQIEVQDFTTLTTNLESSVVAIIHCSSKEKYCHS